jgi:drug/metabolite transporter (DMT)-like permease
MNSSAFPVVAWVIFLGAAVLEVGGDAIIRKGLGGGGWICIGAGCLMLACYGLVVNVVTWDFAKLLGVYVTIFATVSILGGRFLFGEEIPISTWAGLGIIVLGGLVIQYGDSLMAFSRQSP